MKTILLVRHAKASWGSFNQLDFDRSLNDDGVQQAVIMGRKMLAKSIGVEKIISSDALRAKQTAILLAQEINFKVSDIQFERNLYHAKPHIIESEILQISNTFSVAIIVCHNPGISDYINHLVKNVLHDMPTCGVCMIQFETNNWRDITKAKCKLLWYGFPDENEF